MTREELMALSARGNLIRTWMLFGTKQEEVWAIGTEAYAETGEMTRAE